MKTRPFILAILTLIIGFILGMLTSAQLRFHRLKPMRLFFSEERFREEFYNTIQPDEKQKEKIDLILDRYSKINSETQEKFRNEFDLNLKSLRQEVDSNLTREQIERLKAMEKRRQEIMTNQKIKGRHDPKHFWTPYRFSPHRHPPDPGQDPLPPGSDSVKPGETDSSRLQD